jgi:hypothetical protein
MLKFLHLLVSAMVITVPAAGLSSKAGHAPPVQSRARVSGAPTLKSIKGRFR